MTSSRDRPRLPQAEPDPTPTPLEPREIEQAKKQVRIGQRRKGRASTILAGRLMSEHGKVLLGE